MTFSVRFMSEMCCYLAKKNADSEQICASADKSENTYYMMYIFKGSLAQKLPIYERHLSKVKSSRVESSRVESSRIVSSRVESSRVSQVE